jgi:hypothetical protein
MSEQRLYGIALEFDAPSTILEAAKKLREEGFKHFEAYTPYPLKELDEIIPSDNLVPMMVLTGGVIGALTAQIMMYYVAAYEYPINVGGRPLNSWPAFIPITFELTVLFASLAAFFGTLWLAGLPLLHHPVFNLENFARASSDRFFLIVEGSDAALESEHKRESLNELGALAIHEVEAE